MSCMSVKTSENALGIPVLSILFDLLSADAPFDPSSFACAYRQAAQQLSLVTSLLKASAASFGAVAMYKVTGVRAPW